MNSLSLKKDSQGTEEPVSPGFLHLLAFCKCDIRECWTFVKTDCKKQKHKTVIFKVIKD